MRAGKFAASTTLALIAGCSGPFADPARAVPPQAAATAHSQSSDLLYVVNVTNNSVGVYEYPAGTPVGTLSGFTHPQGACTDAAGDVFIANTGAHDIVEYVHGGTHAQRTLDDGQYRPAGCAIDSLTGDLAVANDGTGKPGSSGNVAVYRDARGTPQYFTGLHAYISCAYDDRGDLFVDGEYDSNYYLEELPRGGAALETIHFQNFQVLHFIGWDGSYITDEVPETNWSAIYRFKISEAKAHLQGVTTVSRSGYVFFDRPRVVVAAKSEVAIFDYPSGAGPTKKIADRDGPVSTVVSRASI